MARLSGFLKAGKRTHTHGLTAVAADIRRGRRAFVNGAVVSGVADVKPISAAGGSQRDLFLWQPPTGLTGSYAPSDARGIIINSDRNLWVEASNVTIDTNGYVYTASAYLDFLHVKYLPRQDYTLVVRKLEYWGKTKNATLTSTWGVRLGFNVQHWYNQFWHVELYWNGSVFVFSLQEWNSPTETVRATASFGTALDWPAVWHIVVFLNGDNIIATAMMYQSDNVVDNEAVSIAYNVANRPYKDNHNVLFAVRGTPGDQWLIRGGSVEDNF